MKLIQLKTRHYPPYVKALAFAVFVATPGSMLVLPLVLWWMARRGTLLPNV